MGMYHAVRRSYRYFLPQAILAPRATVRRLWASALFYVIGLYTGMLWYAPRGESHHIRNMFLTAIFCLWVLRAWTHDSGNDEPSKK